MCWLSPRAASALAVALLVLAVLGAAAAVPAWGAPGPVYSSSSGGFLRLVIYYGWLNTSNLQELDVDVVVVAGNSRVMPGGDDYPVVEALRSRGVEVYAYLHDGDEPVGLGSSFRVMVAENSTGTLEERYSYWLSYLESLVGGYAGVFDGVFLDECDPAYFTSDLSSELVSYFTWGVGNLTEYAHSKGLRVFINGVMGYARYGDYYLWEEFLVGYNSTAGSYYYMDWFLDDVGYSSPFEWVNGYARYEYLAENGLLDRTIAVTFADPAQPETLEWARAAHALARVMGLAGWGYANATFYSLGGPIPAGAVEAYEYGPRFEGSLDSQAGTARGVFLASTVYVDVPAGVVEENLTYPVADFILDARGDEYAAEALAGPVQGSYSTLESLGVNASNRGLYVYASWSYQSAPQGTVILHVYIDADGSSATGYQVEPQPGSTMGADLLIEAYTDGTAGLYTYAGSGSDWAWEAAGPLYYTMTQPAQYSYALEALVPQGYIAGNASIAAATVYNYGDDAVAGPIEAPQPVAETPAYYEPAQGLEAYTGVVVEAAVSPDSVNITAEGPSGALVNYTFIVPFDSVSLVTVNGTPLPRLQSPGEEAVGYYARPLSWASGYSLVTVNVEHASPVEVAVLAGQPTPIPEPGALAALAALAGLGLAGLSLTRRRGG